MLDDANNLSQHFYIGAMSGYVDKQIDIIDTIELTPFDVIKSEETIINGYVINNIVIN